MTREDGERVDTRLGREIGVRWRRPGPPVGRPRPAPIGSVARASSRFVQGWGRPVTVRRALAGPSSVPTSGTADLQTRPPRWWSGESPLVAEAPERLSLRPERGLRQVVRPLPEPSDARPTGAWVSSAPTVVPMRLPDEVAAVGRITTSADARSRRLTAPSREAPGFSGGTETSPAADRAVPQGSVSPTSATTSTAPAPRSAPGMARVLRRKAAATRASHAAVAEAARRAPSSSAAQGRKTAASPVEQGRPVAPSLVEQGRQARVETSVGLDTLAGARHSTGEETALSLVEQGRPVAPSLVEQGRQARVETSVGLDTLAGARHSTGEQAPAPSPLPMVVRRVLGADRPSVASTALAADPLRRSVATVGQATGPAAPVPTGPTGQLAVAPDVRGVAALAGARDGGRAAASQTVLRRSLATPGTVPSSAGAPASGYRPPPGTSVSAARTAATVERGGATAPRATAPSVTVPSMTAPSTGATSRAGTSRGAVPAVTAPTGRTHAAGPGVPSAATVGGAAAPAAFAAQVLAANRSRSSSPEVLSRELAMASASPVEQGHQARVETSAGLDTLVPRYSTGGERGARYSTGGGVSTGGGPAASAVALHGAPEHAERRAISHRGLGIERPSLRHEPVLRRSLHRGSGASGWTDVASSGVGGRRSWAAGPAALAARPGRSRDADTSVDGRGGVRGAAVPNRTYDRTHGADGAAGPAGRAPAAPGSRASVGDGGISGSPVAAAITLGAPAAGGPGAVLRRSVVTDAPQVTTYRRRSTSAAPPRPFAWQDGRVPSSSPAAAAQGGLPGAAPQHSWQRDPDIARPTHPWAVQPPRSPAAPASPVEQGRQARAETSAGLATLADARSSTGGGISLGGVLGGAVGAATRGGAGRRGSPAIGTQRSGGVSPSSSTGPSGGAMFETTFPAPGGVLGGAVRQASGASDDTPSADLVARVASKVQESVQHDLRRWLDRELEARVRGVVDERIVAETERRAWRRGAEVF